MSSVWEPSGQEYWLEEVQRYCLDQLAQFRQRSTFSWPMDRIADQPYGYTIHCSIVEAWNAEDRQTDCIEFHQNWLSNLDNVKAAIERKW
jgi:hypothetical protein